MSDERSEERVVLNDLLCCPFCGQPAEETNSFVDASGGDFVYLAYIECDNLDCKVNPTVSVRGTHGYRQADDIPNEKAVELCRKYWNTRAT